MMDLKQPTRGVHIHNKGRNRFTLVSYALPETAASVVRGELQFPKCKPVLDLVEFLDKVSDEELSSSFADVVTQMAQDLTMPGEYRARLIKLGKEDGSEEDDDEQDDDEDDKGDEDDN